MPGTFISTLRKALSQRRSCLKYKSKTLFPVLWVDVCAATVVLWARGFRFCRQALFHFLTGCIYSPQQGRLSQQKQEAHHSNSPGLEINILKHIAENNKLLLFLFLFSEQPTRRVQNRSSGGVKACPQGTQQMSIGELFCVVSFLADSLILPLWWWSLFCQVYSWNPLSLRPLSISVHLSGLCCKPFSFAPFHSPP